MKPGRNRIKASGNVRAGHTAWFVGLAGAALLFVIMSGVKFATLQTLENFDPHDGTGLFWTENAFHYRYARMVAEGKGIPEVDVHMQYPEGMHVRRDEMPMMERFVGMAYRHGSPREMPFHVFLLMLVCLYSSLIIFPAYLLAARAWRSAGAGLVTAAFYALSFSFIGPVVLGSFVRQDFALPFLFLGTYFFIGGLEEEGWRTWLAAALTAFAFASWHLAQFYYLVLLVGVTGAYFICTEQRDALARAVLIMTGVLLGVSFFVLPLRSGGLPVSTAMLLGYALLITHYGLKWKKGAITEKTRAGLFVAALVLLGGLVTLMFGGHVARYSHVYALMLDKIRFLGIKPADPALLSFESRVMWTSSFLSPSFEVMARWMGGAWIAAGIAVFGSVRSMWKARTIVVTHALILWMAVVFVALFAMIHRMDIFAGFFVAVLAGGVFPSRGPRQKEWIKLGMIAALLLLSYHNITRMYIIGGSPSVERIKPLLEEIERNTGPGDVILARFPLSPVICAYTDRPVVIHSKFENRRVREKIREFYEALYDDEEAFHRFCRQYDIQYFVYEPMMLLDLSTESMRYIADRLDLPDHAVAVRMHLLPESLTLFFPVYQSPYHRVFRVLERPRPPGPVPVERLPVYDSRRFRREDLRIHSDAPGT